MEVVRAAEVTCPHLGVRCSRSSLDEDDPVQCLRASWQFFLDVICRTRPDAHPKNTDRTSRQTKTGTGHSAQGRTQGAMLRKGTEISLVNVNMLV